MAGKSSDRQWGRPWPADQEKKTMVNKKDWIIGPDQAGASWLDLDLEAFENQLLHSLEEIGDRTKADWLELQYRLHAPENIFHVGELTPAGDLVCTHCQRKTHFHVPQLLQPCVACHNPEFHFLDDLLH